MAKYIRLCSDNQPLSKETNISFTLNADGVEVYQSTNKLMWPVLLMINELPFTIRYVYPAHFSMQLTHNYYTEKSKKCHSNWSMVFQRKATHAILFKAYH